MGTINCIVSCFIYLLTFMKLYVFKYSNWEKMIQGMLNYQLKIRIS